MTSNANIQRSIGYSGMGRTEEVGGLLSTGLLADTETWPISPYLVQGVNKFIEPDLSIGFTMPADFFGEEFAAIQIISVASMLTAAGNNREGRLRLVLNGTPIPNYAEIDCHTSQRRNCSIIGSISVSPNDRLSMQFENISGADTEFLFVMVGWTINILDLYSS